MTWSPDPAPPEPDVILGHLERGPDEGAAGYIEPADLSAITSALLSRDELTSGDLRHVRRLLGDVHVLTPKSLTDYVAALEARVAALESGEAAPPILPSPEGKVIVDRYGGTFVRAFFRQTDWPTLTLTDGLDHWVTFDLARPGGPNGEVFADTAALRDMAAGATWYDVGGSLGKMSAVTGADIGSPALATWIDEQRMARVSHSVGTDGHPHLTVHELLGTAALQALDVELVLDVDGYSWEGTVPRITWGTGPTESETFALRFTASESDIAALSRPQSWPAIATTDAYPPGGSIRTVWRVRQGGVDLDCGALSGLVGLPLLGHFVYDATGGAGGSAVLYLDVEEVAP
jgi:hypothetical protein